MGLVMTFPPTVEIALVAGHSQRWARIQISLQFLHLEISCALKFSLSFETELELTRVPLNFAL